MASERDILPKWNGRLETLDDFQENVRICVTGTKKDDRCLCGARLIGAMPDGSSQKRLALAFDAAKLQKED
eukprot:14721971-Alexandrium_andersonii.AAC.1